MTPLDLILCIVAILIVAAILIVRPDKRIKR